MTRQFKNGETAFWIVKTEDGEDVRSGKIVAWSEFVKEATNHLTSCNNLVPSNRYRILVDSRKDIPSGFDVASNGLYMEISETRLFKSEEAARENIKEWV